MPQPPFETDAIQIESGSGDTLTISRDSSDGSLSFQDAVATSGVSLKDLAGLRSVSSVFTVGTGLGVEYTTIQSALDAVPAASSASAPSLVLVHPGVYTENLVIEKDGVWIVGLGAKLTSSGVTVTVQESVSVIPRTVVFQNLTIESTGVGGECLRVSGGASSEVASDKVRLFGCDLVASGVGGFQVVADTVNRVEIDGGSFEGSDNLSSVRVTNCAAFSMQSVLGVVGVQLDYDNTDPVPNTVTSSYLVREVVLSGNLQSTLVGVGSLSLHLVSGDPNLTLGGDRSVSAIGCEFGSVVVNDTVSLRLSHSERGTLTGSGTASETIQTGSVAFAASATESVVLSPAYPDDQYQVLWETELTEAMSVTSKTASGFDLSFSGPQTTTVNYAVVRRQ